MNRSKTATPSITAAPVKRTIVQAATERHSKRDEDAIQEKWNERRIRNFRSECDRYELTWVQRDQIWDILRRLDDANYRAPRTQFNPIWEELHKLFEPIRKAQTSGVSLTKEQATTLDEMAKAFGIKRRKPMTLKEADVQSTNPDYIAGTYTAINCQTCVPAYGLRSQGLDVIAKPCRPGSLSEYLSQNKLDYTTTKWHHNAFELWETNDGSIAKPILLCDWASGKELKSLTWKQTKQYIEETCKAPGIYELVLAWRSGGGHATVIQRFEDGTIARIEPQVYNGTMKNGIDWLAKNIRPQVGGYFFGGIIRIDNKRIAKKYWSIFDTKK